MTSRRNQLLKKLIGKGTGEDEAKLYKLTIERICADMCEYYYKFYHNDGPGAMVYVPDHEDEKKSICNASICLFITHFVLKPLCFKCSLCCPIVFYTLSMAFNSSCLMLFVVLFNVRDTVLVHVRFSPFFAEDVLNNWC